MSAQPNYFICDSVYLAVISPQLGAMAAKQTKQ
jgi:hypothetical protein